MAHILDVVDQLLDTLKKLQPLKPEDQRRLDKKFRLEFNYNSNHIEGNTLTYGETELLLIFGNTVGNHSKRELDEMQAHDTAYHLVEQWAKDNERTLTEQDIKELNKIILVSPFWKDAKTADGQDTRIEVKIGSYKEQPNFVRFSNGEKLDFPSPADTPILMQQLVEWYRSEVNNLHPIALAALLHHKLVSIHPFDDGNGRIARLLMNYVLLKYGYPPAIIKSSDKPKYLRALQLADVAEYDALLDYVTEQVIWSLETSIKAAKGESLEDKDDFIKEIELIKRKALSKGIPKSTETIKEIYNRVFIVFFQDLSTTLKYFDNLFKRSNDVFNLEDATGSFQYGTQGEFVSNISKRIFSGDDDQPPRPFSDVQRVNWRHTMFDLDGTDEVPQLTVAFDIIFSKYEYKLELTSAGTSVYVEQKSNMSFFSEREINEISQLLKQSLLEFIKDKIY